MFVDSFTSPLYDELFFFYIYIYILYIYIYIYIFFFFFFFFFFFKCTETCMVIEESVCRILYCQKQPHRSNQEVCSLSEVPFRLCMQRCHRYGCLSWSNDGCYCRCCGPRIGLREQITLNNIDLFPAPLVRICWGSCGMRFVAVVPLNVFLFGFWGGVGGCCWVIMSLHCCVCWLKSRVCVLCITCLCVLSL